MKIDEFRELVNRYMRPMAHILGFSLDECSTPNDASLDYLLWASTVGSKPTAMVAALIPFAYVDIQNRTQPLLMIDEQFEAALSALHCRARKYVGIQKAVQSELAISDKSFDETAEPATAPTDDDGA